MVQLSSANHPQRKNGRGWRRRYCCCKPIILNLKEHEAGAGEKDNARKHWEIAVTIKELTIGSSGLASAMFCFGHRPVIHSYCSLFSGTTESLPWLTSGEFSKSLLTLISASVTG